MASLITVNYENAQTHPNLLDVFDIESGIWKQTVSMNAININIFNTRTLNNTSLLIMSGAFSQKHTSKQYEILM